MSSLSRVVFDAPDGVLRLLVLCAGCLQDVRLKTVDSNMRCVVRDFGSGSGICEFCEHEIKDGAGAL